MKDYKAKKLIESFTAYCKANPNLRFWQALCSWSGASAILFRKINKTSLAGIIEDTFYWENIND